jgi:hypothetical protein
LRIGGGWHIVRSRSIKTNLIIFASTIISTIGLPSMQIPREEMKSNPLKFVLQLFPIRFAYHYHRSHGSLAYFNEMEWFQVFTKKTWKLLHHPIWAKLFSFHAKTTRLMSDANCKDNHNVVKIQNDIKISCLCLLDYFYHELGFLNMKKVKFWQKRHVGEH